MIWVIRTRYFLLIIVIIFIILLLLLALLHLLLGVLRTRLLLLSVLPGSNVNIDFIFFLVRVDLLRIIHVDGEVEWLVLHLVPLYIRSGLGRLIASLSR